MSRFNCKHKDTCICLTCKNTKCKIGQCNDCKILGFSLPTTIKGNGCENCVYVAK